jgi:hypothetical protein
MLPKFRGQGYPPHETWAANFLATRSPKICLKPPHTARSRNRWIKGYSTELVKEDSIVAMVTDRGKERSERNPERVGDYFT